MWVAVSDARREWVVRADSVTSVELEAPPDDYPDWDWTLLVGVLPRDKPLYVSLPREKARTEYARLVSALGA